jgi:signal transduction histidine kinase
MPMDRRILTLGSFAPATSAPHSQWRYCVSGSDDPVGASAEVIACAAADRPRAEAAVHSRDKFAALGRAAGGMAHELNNLLQPIIGLAELELDQISGEGSDDENETRDSLTMILESGNRARDVVRKLLLFARSAKTAAKPVDFSGVLRRVVTIVEESLPPNVNVDLVIDGNATGFAAIDENEFAEVMLSLARNSVEAANGPANLTIRAGRVEAKDIAASLGISARSVFRIAVADDGPGMSPGILAQIFQPFFTTKVADQGRGLGLSIVHGVLRDWNGAIAVDSTAGLGSTFTIYLPVVAVT